MSILHSESWLKTQIYLELWSECSSLSKTAWIFPLINSSLSCKTSRNADWKGCLEVIESCFHHKAGLLPALDHINPLSTLLLFFESQLSHDGFLQPQDKTEEKGKTCWKNLKAVGDYFGFDFKGFLLLCHPRVPVFSEKQLGNGHVKRASGGCWENSGKHPLWSAKIK